MRLSENHAVHTNGNDKLKASVTASAAKTTLNSTKKVTGKKIMAKVSVVLESAIKDEFVLIPFGSAVFGFAGSNSNCNIFIDTCTYKQKTLYILTKISVYIL